VSRVLAIIGLAAVGLVAPAYLERFWLQLAMFAFAGAVAALGLTILIGQAGQLSLGHSFFVAVGAYSYALLAADDTARVAGLGLPPMLAALAAVMLAGFAGLLFTPIAARLRGIYLGIATMGLVFGGQHLLFNMTSLSGGSNGRSVPEIIPTENLYVLDIPFGRPEKLWYVGLAVTVVAYFGCRAAIRSRTGRALRAIHQGELMAGILGVPVNRYKGYAFLISSMYAGLGGVLLALAYGRIVPDTFGLDLAVAYLVMVVIGGLGSAGGAIAGAMFVSCLPSVLERYADVLPGLALPGSDGISPAVAAKFAFGAAVIALLLFEPRGAAAIGARLKTALSLQMKGTDRDAL
jgi:branched-chain amino acid transport system permease protein